MPEAAVEPLFLPVRQMPHADVATVLLLPQHALPSVACCKLVVVAAAVVVAIVKNLWEDSQWDVSFGLT